MERDAQIVTVREFMTRAVHTLPEGLPIDEALDRLRRAGHSGAPVVDAAGFVVGILSEVDCMKVLASAAFLAMPTGPVSAFMTREIETLSPDQDLFAAAHRFQATHFRRFPVVENGELVGLVTVRDLDRALWQLTQDRLKVHREAEHPPGAAWDPRRNP
jgi:CBS domain-containing protein